ncbi:MAG: PqiC family protein [Pseudomonadota bacterium]|nr:PqiC family protein [Pseudomonadota bacterium]
MIKAIAMSAICCAVAALIGACASVAPQLYALSPVAASSGEASDLAVTVGPVSVPEAVDRPQLVSIMAPHKLRIDEFNRWASPLKNDIPRVVAENLAALLGSPYVSVFPQSVAVAPSYRVVIDVARFDYAPGVEVRLGALWSVRSTADGKSRSGAATLVEPGGGVAPAAMVAAHSRMLGRLSGDIAAAIRSLAADARKGATGPAKGSPVGISTPLP